MTALTCAEVVVLLTEWLEGALPAEESARVSEHLAACEDCDRYLDQLKATVDALGHVSLDRLTPSTREGLLRAFANWPRQRS
jgi:anti-sigma factor RsiW